MKKIICIILLLFCCIGVCACDKNSAENDNVNNYTNATDKDSITKSEAESKATSALYIKLKAHYLYVDEYDITQTRYSVGSITGSGTSGYTVNGTYSLYDKYGNYKKSNNFSVAVDSDGHTTVTEY